MVERIGSYLGTSFPLFHGFTPYQTPDNDNNIYVELKVESPTGTEFEKPVVDNKAKLDICREHLKLTLEYDGVESDEFQFYPINYTQLILDNTCADGDIVLVDVEKIIDVNSTFAACHSWIKILETEDNNEENLIGDVI